MKNTIQSRDHKNIYAHFDVLVDPKPSHGLEPAVAIMVEPRRAEKFLLPMDLKTARDLGVILIDAITKVSPELMIELFNQ